MADKFKVGDICIGRGFVKLPEMNGRECEIVRERSWVNTTNTATGEVGRRFAYLVIWQGLEHPSAVLEENLYKKGDKPDDAQPCEKKDLKGSWDEIEKICGWNPTKQLVEVESGQQARESQTS